MRTTRTLEQRFWPKVAKLSDGECWNWTASCTSHGYGQISTKRGQRPAAAHRVAYEIAHGPIPDGMHILHSCDNPACCNPAHLRAGTPADNRQDASRRLRARGGIPKLDKHDVRAIRQAVKNGSTQTSLAIKYGVHQATISYAMSKNWKWVK